MTRKHYNLSSNALRRGVSTVYVALSGVAIMAFAAMAIDMGSLYTAKNELQRAADAGALAGAFELLNEERLQGGAAEDAVHYSSREMASNAAWRNVVAKSAPQVDLFDDVQLGVWREFGTPALDFNSGVGPFNAVRVNAQRNSSRGGSLTLSFGSMFGIAKKDLSANAVAGFSDAVSGFRVTASSGNAQLLPFTLHEDWWHGLLAGTHATGDHYSYDPDSGSVSPGSDGVLELNLYPGAGSGQLPPGNFGTVDIGSPNNSTADLSRQILHGINAYDLSFFGGKIEFGADGTLLLNGDTGLSAGIKDELAAIIGQPRVIPIFRTVSGNGNNANYVIVEWAGIRILDVKLTGSMKSKYLIIQPAQVIDPTAITSPNGNATYVYRPVQLVQ